MAVNLSETGSVEVDEVTIMRAEVIRVVRRAQPVLILMIPMALVACFGVRVKKNVRNPRPFFSQAHARIERIHREDPHRHGRPRVIRLLIYAGEECDLVRIDAPFWLLDMGMDFERETRHSRSRRLEDGYDFEWREELRDLRKAGPGLLVEIEENGNRVLIWIE